MEFEPTTLNALEDAVAIAYTITPSEQSDFRLLMKNQYLGSDSLVKVENLD